MKKLVRLEVGNLGTELWLVSNPEETIAAWEADCPPEDSPLDAAARVSRDCIVLRAHWGNDIPRDRDADWLEKTLADTDGVDRDEVADLIETWWDS